MELSDLVYLTSREVSLLGSSWASDGDLSM